MAVTNQLFNHTAKVMANSEVNIGNLKVMLVMNYTFDPYDTTMDYPDNSEVYGFGWDQGGEPLVGVNIAITGTNDARLDATDLSVTASGGTIGPATGAIVFEEESPDRLPLAYIDFGATESAGNGTNFNITWDSTGIITWTYT